MALRMELSEFADRVSEEHGKDSRTLPAHMG